MNIELRNAELNDITDINDIYNYYVLNSTCTYQTEIETINNRKIWFDEHNDEYPIIVAITNNEITGWASLSKFSIRQAYKPTVGNSIYIKNEFRGKGIGSILLKKIIELASSNKYHSIIAGISADQTASINLHMKFNFKKTAQLKEVGFKFNKWLDVVYYQLML